MTSKELKTIRTRLGLTQTVMASLLGMNQHDYSRIETGYRNRKPTKHHTAQVGMLEFIFKKGLLPELLEIYEKTVISILSR